MADEVVTSTPEIAPTAPVVVSEATPALETTQDTASSSVTPADSSPQEASSEVVAAAAAPEPAPNVLGDLAGKPADANAPKDGEAATTPAEAPAAAVELPTYEAFTLPDFVKMDAPQLGEFNKILGEMEVAKATLDHDGFQTAGQKLIDLGTTATKQSIDNLHQYYVDLHESQKKEWYKNFTNDEVLGGGNLEATTSNLRSAIEYAGNTEQRAEFQQLMKDTGVGNHPAVIRLLNNMQSKINKYETESDVNQNGTRMVIASRPAPNKVQPYKRFYS